MKKGWSAVILILSLILALIACDTPTGSGDDDGDGGGGGGGGGVAVDPVDPVTLSQQADPVTDFGDFSPPAGGYSAPSRTDALDGVGEALGLIVGAFNEFFDFNPNWEPANWSGTMDPADPADWETATKIEASGKFIDEAFTFLGLASGWEHEGFIRVGEASVSGTFSRTASTFGLSYPDRLGIGLEAAAHLDRARVNERRVEGELMWVNPVSLKAGVLHLAANLNLDADPTWKEEGVDKITSALKLALSVSAEASLALTVEDSNDKYDGNYLVTLSWQARVANTLELTETLLSEKNEAALKTYLTSKLSGFSLTIQVYDNSDTLLATYNDYTGQEIIDFLECLFIQVEGSESEVPPPA